VYSFTDNYNNMKYPKVQNYINGAFVNIISDRSLPVISPLDGELLSEVPLSTAKDLDAAVKAAKAAFPAWSRMPIKERIQVFFRYKYLLEKYLKDLATLVHEENGKTYGEAVAEIEKHGIDLEPIRVDEYTGKRFTFFADPDGLPIEFYDK